MPAKEPLTKKGKLSKRGKTKLRSQIERAESIMKRSPKYGKNSQTYWQAQRMRARAYKLLGATSKEASPGGKAASKARTGVRAAAELVHRAKAAKERVVGGMKKVREKSEEAASKGHRVKEGPGIKGRGAYQKHFRKPG
jgi:hypothetical protein